jgi:hypothetical protein
LGWSIFNSELAQIFLPWYPLAIQPAAEDLNLRPVPVLLVLPRLHPQLLCTGERGALLTIIKRLFSRVDHLEEDHLNVMEHVNDDQINVCSLVDQRMSLHF